MSDESVKQNLVTVGGRQFVASCLTLGVFRRNADALRIVMNMRGRAEGELPSPEEFDAIITIVDKSLKPADGVPCDFVSLVDGLEFKSGVKDVLDAMVVVMKASGYVEKEKAQESGSGEAASAVAST